MYRHIGDIWDRYASVIYCMGCMGWEALTNWSIPDNNGWTGYWGLPVHGL